MKKLLIEPTGTNSILLSYNGINLEVRPRGDHLGLHSIEENNSFVEIPLIVKTSNETDYENTGKVEHNTSKATQILIFKGDKKNE